MTTLSVSNLTLTYPPNATPVLNDVTFIPEANSFNLLIGPSGSGKSSLLKAMAGLLPEFGGQIVAGTIQLDEHPITKVVPFERAKRVAFLFQHPNRQFAMLTAREEMAFALENIQVPAADIPQRIEALLVELGLSTLADKTFQHLSGGEQQKLALATTLALGADIILLDEPFANVDPASRLDLLAWLHDLTQKHGKTIVIADHDLSGYADLADTVSAIDPVTHTLTALPLTHLAKVPATVPPFAGQPNGNAPLAWTNLTLAVGEQTLLTDSQFQLGQGQIGLLSGDNGAGKSTLFKALTHFMPYTGAITWDGIDSQRDKFKTWAQKVGYVFQQATDQFVTLTVAEEIVLSRQHSYRASYWDDATVAAALAQLNLTDLQDQVVYQLSGGQQKKVQVLAMLIMSQPVLLLDEPLAGLDGASADALLALIKATSTALDLSVMLISHQRHHLRDIVDYEVRLANQTLTILDGKELTQYDT